MDFYLLFVSSALYQSGYILQILLFCFLPYTDSLLNCHSLHMLLLLQVLVYICLYEIRYVQVGLLYPLVFGVCCSLLCIDSCLIFVPYSLLSEALCLSFLLFSLLLSPGAFLLSFLQLMAAGYKFGFDCKA